MGMTCRKWPGHFSRFRRDFLALKQGAQGFQKRCERSAGRRCGKRGSHQVLSRKGWPDYVFAFHDSEEIRAKKAFAHRETHGLKAGGFMMTICLLFVEM